MSANEFIQWYSRKINIYDYNEVKSKLLSMRANSPKMYEFLAAEFNKAHPKQTSPRQTQEEYLADLAEYKKNIPKGKTFINYCETRMASASNAPRYITKMKSSSNITEMVTKKNAPRYITDMASSKNISDDDEYDTCMASESNIPK